MSTGAIAVSAFLSAVIREWRDQPNKGPINGLIYKWARVAFIVHFALVVAFVVAFLGAMAAIEPA